MKLLVLGSNSQLGTELTKLLTARNIDFYALGTDEIDLTDQTELLKASARINPSQIINVSSFSSLVKAESDPEASKECEIINTLIPTAIAAVCHRLKLPLIHHSSSYVFDGTKPQPYSETDETNPASRYGLSKWYGERAIRDAHEQHIILRTDWLFSVNHSRLFSNHIEACKKNKGKIEVVGHRFSPTPAEDAARVLLAIVEQLDCNAEPWGTYHYCALQAVSQEQFVESFLHEAAEYDPELAQCCGNLEITILPVQAPFISNSSLSFLKLMETFGIKQRSRASAITSVLKNLLVKSE